MNPSTPPYIPIFGSGAPSQSAVTGSLYFDTGNNFASYIRQAGAWQPVNVQPAVMTVTNPSGNAQISLTGNGGCSILIERFSNDATAGALNGRKSRGTIASPLKLALNDQLGSVAFGGQNADGLPIANTTGISMQGFLIETGTIGPTVFGSQLRISVTAIGSATLTEMARFTNNTTTGFETRNSCPITSANFVKTSSKLVSALVAAATAGAGARDFVTDATSATFGAAVVGSGSNAVPVWSNGTGWFVG